MVQYTNALDALRALHPNKVKLATMVQGLPDQRQFDVRVYKLEETVSNASIPVALYSKVLADDVMAADAAMGEVKCSAKGEYGSACNTQSQRDTTCDNTLTDQSICSFPSDLTLINSSIDQSLSTDYSNFALNLNPNSPHVPDARTTSSVARAVTPLPSTASIKIEQENTCKRKACLEDCLPPVKRIKVDPIQSLPEWISSSSTGNILSSDAFEEDSANNVASFSTHIFKQQREIAFPVYSSKDITHMVHSSFDPIDSDF